MLSLYTFQQLSNSYNKSYAVSRTNILIYMSYTGVLFQIPHQDEFVRFLTSCKGWFQSEQQALRHVNNVSAVLRVTSCGPEDSRFRQTLIDVITEKVSDKTWAPNTAKTYLNSVRVYLKFISKCQAMNVAEFSDYNQSVLNSVIDDILDSKRGLERMVKKNKPTPNATQYVNPSDLGHYLISAKVTAVKHMLTQQTPVVECTPADTLAIRNYVIFCIVVANGCRTGCITNMTLEEFETGSEIIRAGHHIVKVASHKTASVYGPAEIVFTPDMYRDAQQYIENFRPKSEDPHLFVNLTGSQMSAGTVSNALTRELRRAGVDKKLNCTKLRHLAVTLAYNVLDSEKDRKGLAQLLSHSSMIAERSYNDAIKSSSNVRMSRIVTKLLTETSLSEEDLKKADCGEWLNFVCYCSLIFCLLYHYNAIIFSIMIS